MSETLIAAIIAGLPGLITAIGAIFLHNKNAAKITGLHDLHRENASKIADLHAVVASPPIRRV